jgi:diaminohydroxyphosphoribosylaminopyrimidine deaminase/5-amino-6-(5-phosphoribosylamino)uracil reductase
MNYTDNDIAFMNHALALAKRHTGLTRDNPSVGCVIVKDNIIIGRGVTAIGGRPHAETIALKQVFAQAGNKAKNAIVYVTLEPCSHYGKTPPCAEALIKAGVHKVFVGILDMDNRVDGRGIALLNKAGIKTDIGLLASEIQQHHQPFFTNTTKHRPFYTVKFAASLDGRINFYPNTERKQISSDLNIMQAHKLRSQHHAIAVGIGTIIADNPLLNCRLNGLENYNPDVIIFDNQCRIDANSRVFSLLNRRIFIFHSPEHTPKFQKQNVIYAPIANDFGAVNQFLLSQHLYSVLIEGGATLQTSFLNAGLYDNIIAYGGRMIIGSQAQSAFGMLDKPIFL